MALRSLYSSWRWHWRRFRYGDAISTSWPSQIIFLAQNLESEKRALNKQVELLQSQATSPQDENDIKVLYWSFLASILFNALALKALEEQLQLALSELEEVHKNRSFSLNRTVYVAFQLREENEQMRTELEAFDPAFFEEIEDLKASTACVDYRLDVQVLCGVAVQLQGGPCSH